MKNRLTTFKRLMKLIASPGKAAKAFSRVPDRMSASSYCEGYPPALNAEDSFEVHGHENPLYEYFVNNLEGRGIWKWEHYFDVYHRHLAKFVGEEVNLMEVGIYSGGSLGMWQYYLGPLSTIYGVDIEKACKTYESENVNVFIGDQEDPIFWKQTKEVAPKVDVLIDDGGHQADQQIVTLQEMLPHLTRGGVYICEDISGRNNRFASYVSGLCDELNSANILESGEVEPIGLQKDIYSVHQYPFITVIEKTACVPKRFSAPKYGTEWQPFKF